MRKSIKAVCAAGSTALIMGSGSVWAQAVPELGNLDFGEMAILDDDTACEGYIAASGVTCNTLAEGDGFIQRQIDYNGNIFIQTVIEDNGFEAEDYVRIEFGNTGGGIQGIASKLSVFEGGADATAVNAEIDAGNTAFISSGVIYSGWAFTTLPGGGAADAGDSRAILEVNLADAGDTADPESFDAFMSKFSVDTVFDKSANDNVIVSMVADQMVELGNAARGAGDVLVDADGDLATDVVNYDGPVVDKQEFYTAIKEATDFTGGTDGSAITNPGYTMGADGIGEVRYNSGDLIQVVWVGQRIDGLGSFGASNLSNLDVATYDAGGPEPEVNQTSLSDLTGTGPFEWVDTPGNRLFDEFGVAPTF